MVFIEPTKIKEVSFYAAPYFWREKHNPVRLEIQAIIDAVCEELEITEKSLKSQTRVQRYVRGRHYCFLIARKHTTMTLADIGRALGRRDHTTVVHGLQLIPFRIKHEECCAAEYRRICKTLGIEP